MKKYRCIICNYIYDPAKGDAAGGIKPGTAFEDLPDDWVCPVCGAAKSQFVPADSTAQKLGENMKMKMPKPKDVDSYIASSEPEARPTLEELRKVIKSTIPEVEEGISWGVPFYKYHGQIGGFAAYKNHVSFGPWVDVLQSEDRKMLEEKGYKTGKRTIQIKFDQKVPTTAIKQILKAIAKKNEHNQD